MLLRRLATHAAAMAHAARVTLALWDDVRVVQAEESPPKPEPTEPPPFPWSVLWVAGRSYVLDARGAKIATLLGSQKQREFVAGILIDLTGGEQ